MTEDQFARFVEYAESRFQQMATKADLERLATKADLERFATKSDLEQLATKADVQALRLEMRERFEIVHDRLVALENGNKDLRSGLAKVRAQVSELSTRIDKLEGLAHETNTRLTDLREEMQQRFRSVNERLSALEQRIAA